jgi:cation diffusion facilitator CzcD-associated flavoprotein CzcO
VSRPGNGKVSRSPRVVIVGAGVAGICMGIKLKQAGIDTFTIYEKASSLGGTWRDNTYPGLACDVPSRFYTYSFEPNPSWTRYFSSGPEILRYLERTAARYGVDGHIRFRQEVIEGSFAGGQWRIRTSTGEEATADFLVTATGFLHHPKIPAIPGLDRFDGPVFHSARWDHRVELEGRRVALVGTGSSGVQITVGIAGMVERLLVFQRTAQWIFPAPNRPYTRAVRWALGKSDRLDRIGYRAYRWIFERFFAPAMLEDSWKRRVVTWICRQWLKTIRDPNLRRRMTPDYEPMCKRLVMSGSYLRVMQQPNVDLVTDPIDHIDEHGIVTADGVRHDVDVIVLATGFDGHAYMRPMNLVGEDGRTLADTWKTGPRAYRTVALPGFPNLFMLVGPNSPVGSQNVMTVVEAQVEHVMGWVRRFRDGLVTRVAPTEEATDRFNHEVVEALPGTVWLTGCNSWYMTEQGLPDVFPWGPDRHRQLLSEIDWSELQVEQPDLERLPAE